MDDAPETCFREHFFEVHCQSIILAGLVPARYTANDVRGEQKMQRAFTIHLTRAVLKIV